LAVCPVPSLALCRFRQCLAQLLKKFFESMTSLFFFHCFLAAAALYLPTPQAVAFLSFSAMEGVQEASILFLLFLKV